MAVEAAGRQGAAGEASAAAAGAAEAEGGAVVRPEELSTDQLQVGVMGGCGALVVVLVSNFVCRRRPASEGTD